MAPMKRKSHVSVADTRSAKKQRRSPPSAAPPKEEPAFPRGGASVLTPLEHKQIQIQARQDVLFEQSTGKKPPKQDFEDEENEAEIHTLEGSDTSRVQSKARLKKQKSKPITVTEQKTIRIEGLSYKRLVPGSMVLGQVTQINRHDVALSLPNNLTGYVPLTLISDTITRSLEKAAEYEENDTDDQADEDEDKKTVQLSSLFSMGQYLRAHVVSTEDRASLSSKVKKHISLSLNPQQVNAGLSGAHVVPNSMVQAAVHSVEDHGLVMDLGLEDSTIKGFMSSKELGEQLDLSKAQEGAVFLCLVLGQSSNGKIVKLSIDQRKIENIKKSAFLADAPTVNSFLPGTAVDVLVSHVTASGLVGKVMGMINVTADLIQSGAASSEKELEKKHVVGSKTKARIICTFPTSEENKLGVSLQDHVLYWREKMAPSPISDKNTSPTQLLPLSSIVEKAVVVKVESNLGLFMDVGVKGVRGFAHISCISDKKIETLSSTDGSYKIGSTHRTRIIGYNAMDGLFLVSLESRILEQPFLRLEDVKPGQLTKGTIEKMIVSGEGITGLILRLADGVTGLVPEMHLSDVQLQNPERKFKEGNTVNARVLFINLQKRQIRLTLKKSLVNSDIEPWTEYESLEPGMRSPGTLVNVLPSGSVVQFYGSVRAFLPISEMSESFIQDPREHFRPGQVVSVHIVSVDVNGKRMVVSCKDPLGLGTNQRQALTNLELGARVGGCVIEKTQDEIIIALQSSGLIGKLHIEHLTDGSAAKASSTARRIRVGQDLKDLVVMRKEGTKNLVRLSGKPSIVKAAEAGQLPRQFEEVREGAEVAGYVNGITPTGVFVHFANNLSALAPKYQLPDGAVLLPDFGMRQNQSVLARVFSIDHSKQRFLLSMKPTDQTLNYSTKNDFASNDTILMNAVDEECKSTGDFTFGKVTKAKVSSVKSTQLNVQLADGVQGRVDVSSIFDSWDEIKDKKHPLKRFHPKEILPVRILGKHDSRNHRFLPITHRSPKAPVFELTCKQSEIDLVLLETLTVDQVKVGSSWIVYVNNVAEDCLWVNLSPNVRGRIRAMDASDNVSLLTDMFKNFPLGSAMRAKVVKVDIENNRLDLTARDGGLSSSLELEKLSKGQILPGRITRITDRQMMVQLSEHISGPVHLVDIADDYSKANPWIYKKNQTIRVCIKDVDVHNKKLPLSCRPSQVLSSSLPVEDPDLRSTEEVNVNDIRRGFIKNVADNGIFVALSSAMTAYIRVTDLSDLYIKDWKANFKVDQLVKGKVISVDTMTGHIQMSLRQSHLDQNYKPPLTFNDVNVEQVVTGKVRKVQDFGVFVVFDNSANVSGLCHRTEMSDQANANPKKLYEEGDVVQAKILSINKEKRQISLGLKASYFDGPLDDGHEEEMALGSTADSLHDSAEENEDDPKNRVMINGGRGHQVIDDTEIPEAEEKDSDVGMQQDEEGGVPLPESGKTGSSLASSFPGLSTGGFDWTGGMAGFEDRDIQSETDAESSAPRRKKKRKVEIKIDQTGELDANGPQSVADFERLLLGQPNSSALWLGYMAFQMQLGELNKARDIAERALKSIHIREEGEKLNVWIALLNLENTYGNEDSLDEAFKRACQYNDSEDIHTRLISIYIQSGQHHKADDLFQATLKKHTQTPDLYLNYATFLMTTQNEADQARALLPRAMQALPSFTHLNLTSKFAQLEFHSPNGEAERGRTIFETLLSQWPKRLDVWNVLFDLEIQQGDKEVVRKLFERVTSAGMKLKPRKAKFFFKRWLEYEEKVGDSKSQERVKSLAAAYVEKQGKSG